jgi:hypothetical protein
MAQRKTDGAIIEQLKDLVFTLQEQNGELLKALENLIPLAARETCASLPVCGHERGLRPQSVPPDAEKLTGPRSGGRAQDAFIVLKRPRMARRSARHENGTPIRPPIQGVPLSAPGLFLGWLRSSS